MSISLKNEFENQIPEFYKVAVDSALNCAEENGFNIYLIGGVVRDLILSNEIKDIDIVVVGNAIDFCNVLENNLLGNIINIQENLKTVKFCFSNGAEIDFASTREEKYTKSGVLPIAYNFGCSLKSDVYRRDFTINTLAIALTGENKYCLVDYFNGYKDIQNKQIRILHKKSFVDDPSRIIRAIKFQTRFDFNIEDETYSLMQEYLKNVDKTMPLERIKSELKQYFSIKKTNLFKNLIDMNIYKLISDNFANNFDENALKNMKKYNIFNDKDLCFIFLALCIINNDFIDERLNLSSNEKKIINEIKNLLKTKNTFNDDKFIYKKYSNLFDLSICIYYILTKDCTVKRFLENLKEIKVLITGNDLINLGFKPSKYFSEIFEQVLDKKIDGNLKTKEDEIEFVKNLAKKEK
jgi:tRNA nucleotidyltransferase/poly(A) polymerase